MSAVLKDQVAYENRCEAERDRQDERDEQLSARIDAIVADKLADYEWTSDAIGQVTVCTNARPAQGASRGFPAVMDGKPLLDLFTDCDAIAFHRELMRRVTAIATNEAREELRGEL